MSAAGRKKRGNRESSASGGKDETARAGAEPGGPGGQWDPEAVFGEESTSVENLDVVGNLQAQVDALGGQLARVTAEYDNFRKRTRDEREKTVLYANEALVTDLLPILDDFARATEHMGLADQEPAEVFDGIRLIRRRLERMLEQRGVRSFEALGERFDPYLHEAVRTREQEGVPPGTVLEVFESGFMYQDRLLRAAKVAVTPLKPAEKPGKRRRKDEVREEPPEEAAEAVPGETLPALPSQADLAGTVVDIAPMEDLPPEPDKEPSEGTPGFMDGEERMIEVELPVDLEGLGADSEVDWQMNDDIVVEDDKAGDALEEEGFRDEKTRPET